MVCAARERLGTDFFVVFATSKQMPIVHKVEAARMISSFLVPQYL
jgi:hypothetical protein